MLQNILPPLRMSRSAVRLRPFQRRVEEIPMEYLRFMSPQYSSVEFSTGRPVLALTTTRPCGSFSKVLALNVPRGLPFTAYIEVLPERPKISTSLPTSEGRSTTLLELCEMFQAKSHCQSLVLIGVPVRRNSTPLLLISPRLTLREE